MSVTICIDFDGVLHSYVSGWRGADVVEDPPVPGAILWLTRLISNVELRPVIYSSRSKDPAGIAAMQAWLTTHGLHPHELAELEFPTQKPAAWLTIDDRCMCFEGEFPSIERMLAFVPWNKKE